MGADARATRSYACAPPVVTTADERGLAPPTIRPPTDLVDPPVRPRGNSRTDTAFGLHRDQLVRAPLAARRCRNCAMQPVQLIGAAQTPPAPCRTSQRRRATQVATPPPAAPAPNRGTPSRSSARPPACAPGTVPQQQAPGADDGCAGARAGHHAAPPGPDVGKPVVTVRRRAGGLAPASDRAGREHDSASHPGVDRAASNHLRRAARARLRSGRGEGIEDIARRGPARRPHPALHARGGRTARSP